MDAAERYRLTLTSCGRRVMQGWWGNRAVAERKLTRWIGEHGTLPEPRVTLVDEETGSVLTTWSDEP